MSLADNLVLRYRPAATIGRLDPGAFAVVMASGIVSIAAEQQGMHAVAVVLFWAAPHLRLLRHRHGAGRQARAGRGAGRHLAAGRGCDPGGCLSRRGDRAPYRAGRRPVPLRHALSLVHRLHALHRAHLVDLLPAGLLPGDGRGAGRTLLDQHWGGGDYHAGRSAAHAPLATLAFPGDYHSLPERLHAVLLGGWSLVDPLTPRTGVLALRHSALPRPLRPPVLEHGLPARYVHRLYLPAGAGHQPGVPVHHPPLRRLRRPLCLGLDLRRPVAFAGPRYHGAQPPECPEQPTGGGVAASRVPRSRPQATSRTLRSRNLRSAPFAVNSAARRYAAAAPARLPLRCKSSPRVACQRRYDRITGTAPRRSTSASPASAPSTIASATARLSSTTGEGFKSTRRS